MPINQQQVTRFKQQLSLFKVARSAANTSSARSALEKTRKQLLGDMNALLLKEGITTGNGLAVLESDDSLGKMFDLLKAAAAKSEEAGAIVTPVEAGADTPREEELDEKDEEAHKPPPVVVSVAVSQEDIASFTALKKQRTAAKALKPSKKAAAIVKIQGSAFTLLKKIDPNVSTITDIDEIFKQLEQRLQTTPTVERVQEQDAVPLVPPIIAVNATKDTLHQTVEEDERVVASAAISPENIAKYSRELKALRVSNMLQKGDAVRNEAFALLQKIDPSVIVPIADIKEIFTQIEQRLQTAPTVERVQVQDAVSLVTPVIHGQRKENDRVEALSETADRAVPTKEEIRSYIEEVTLFLAKLPRPSKVEKPSGGLFSNIRFRSPFGSRSTQTTDKQAFELVARGNKLILDAGITQKAKDAGEEPLNIIRGTLIKALEDSAVLERQSPLPTQNVVVEDSGPPPLPPPHIVEEDDETLSQVQQEVDDGVEEIQQEVQVDEEVEASSDLESQIEDFLERVKESTGGVAHTGRRAIHWMTGVSAADPNKELFAEGKILLGKTSMKYGDSEAKNLEGVVALLKQASAAERIEEEAPLDTRPQDHDQEEAEQTAQERFMTSFAFLQMAIEDESNFSGEELLEIRTSCIDNLHTAGIDVAQDIDLDGLHAAFTSHISESPDLQKFLDEDAEIEAIDDDRPQEEDEADVEITPELIVEIKAFLQEVATKFEERGNDIKRVLNYLGAGPDPHEALFKKGIELLEEANLDHTDVLKLEDVLPLLERVIVEQAEADARQFRDTETLPPPPGLPRPVGSGIGEIDKFRGKINAELQLTTIDFSSLRSTIKAKFDVLLGEPIKKTAIDDATYKNFLKEIILLLDQEKGNNPFASEELKDINKLVTTEAARIGLDLNVEESKPEPPPKPPVQVKQRTGFSRLMPTSLLGTGKKGPYLFGNYRKGQGATQQPVKGGFRQRMASAVTPTKVRNFGLSDMAARARKAVVGDKATAKERIYNIIIEALGAIAKQESISATNKQDVLKYIALNLNGIEALSDIPAAQIKILADREALNPGIITEAIAEIKEVHIAEMNKAIHKADRTYKDTTKNISRLNFAGDTSSFDEYTKARASYAAEAPKVKQALEDLASQSIDSFIKLYEAVLSKADLDLTVIYIPDLVKPLTEKLIQARLTALNKEAQSPIKTMLINAYKAKLSIIELQNKITKYEEKMYPMGEVDKYRALHTAFVELEKQTAAAGKINKIISPLDVAKAQATYETIRRDASYMWVNHLLTKIPVIATESTRDKLEEMLIAMSNPNTSYKDKLYAYNLCHELIKNKEIQALKVHPIVEQALLALVNAQIAAFDLETRTLKAKPTIPYIIYLASKAEPIYQDIEDKKVVTPDRVSAAKEPLLQAFRNYIKANAAHITENKIGIFEASDDADPTLKKAMLKLNYLIFLDSPGKYELDATTRSGLKAATKKPNKPTGGSRWNLPRQYTGSPSRIAKEEEDHHSTTPLVLAPGQENVIVELEEEDTLISELKGVQGGLRGGKPIKEALKTKTEDEETDESTSEFDDIDEDEPKSLTDIPKAPFKPTDLRTAFREVCNEKQTADKKYQLSQGRKGYVFNKTPPLTLKYETVDQITLKAPRKVSGKRVTEADLYTGETKSWVVLLQSMQRSRNKHCNFSLGTGGSPDKKADQFLTALLQAEGGNLNKSALSFAFREDGITRSAIFEALKNDKHEDVREFFGLQKDLDNGRLQQLPDNELDASKSHNVNLFYQEIVAQNRADNGARL